MVKLGVVSQKGGCGKTTVARHLAVLAQGAGVPGVTIVDVDPQATTDQWNDLRRQAGYEGPLVRCVVGRLVGKELDALERAGCGLAIVDTAAGAGAETSRVGKLVDALLIPCRTWGEDLFALEQSLELARYVRKPARIALNAVEARSAEGVGARQYLESLGEDVLQAELGNRVAFSRSYMRGMVAAELEPGGKAAEEALALYREVAEWLGLPGGSRKGRRA